MIYKYEMACKEAGLSEEQTAEIRKFFDAEKKKLRRDMDAREAEGIVFNSITTFTNNEEDSETFELVSDMNLEEMLIHQMNLENLNDCLQELSADDREFLFIIFSGERGMKAAYAKTHNCSEAAVTRRKNRLMKVLRKKFFEKI
jgi:DNA-directed RNA polymerase specialized sigma subunit